MEILKTNCQLGESPVYDHSNFCVYWLDLDLGYVHKYNLKKKVHSSFKIKIKTPLGSLLRTNKGNFLITSDSGIHLLNPQTKKFLFIADFRKDKENFIYNDGLTDGKKIYFGLSDRKEKKPIGFFYFFNGKSLSISATKYPVANGPSIYKDLIAYSNSAFKRIEICSKRNNKIKKKIYLRSGYPDGTCFDSKGGLWVAHWGGGRISRYTKDFKKDFSIQLPAKNITSLCFVGNKKDQLFITSAKVETNKTDLKKYPSCGDTFIIQTNYKGVKINDFDEINIKKLKLLHHQH